MDFVTRNDQWGIIAKEAFKAQQLRKKYQELEAKYLEELKGLSCEQSSCFGAFRFLRIERPGVIKYSEIPELKTLNLEPYRGAPVTAWKLSKHLI